MPLPIMLLVFAVAPLTLSIAELAKHARQIKDGKSKERDSQIEKEKGVLDCHRLYFLWRGCRYHCLFLSLPQKIFWPCETLALNAAGAV